MPGSILIVEDDVSTRLFLATSIRRDGYVVREASTVEEALDQLRKHPIDLVILDLGLPDRSGMELLPEVTASDPNLPVIVLTSSQEPADAVLAMKLRACDFLIKPPNLVSLKQIIAHLLNTAQLHDHIEVLKSSQGDASQPFVLGKSRAMGQVLEMVEDVAPLPTSVLILGESGTGKERIARLLHDRSPRARHPFVAVNTAAIPDNLMESEFFGAMRGSYSGATKDRKGIIEHTHGGTLFLDEISSMKPDLQVKLLRVLEDGKVRRLGSSSDIEVDTRIISASNQDLQEMIQAGTFREDLYYRLAVVVIELPPLRERLEDIPDLTAAYIDHFNRELSRFVEGVTPEALSCLKAYSWPGNIRELRNVIERAMIRAKEGEIGLEHLPRELQRVSLRAISPRPTARDDPGRLAHSLVDYDKQLISQALVQADGDHEYAARLLGITVEEMDRRLAASS